MLEPQSKQQNSDNKPFEIDPIGFENRLNYPFLYHQLITKLNELHGIAMHEDAITHFSMMLPTFGGLFDTAFITNCYEISKAGYDDFATYQLQKVEFSRLMTRAGIAPKPDIRIRYKAMWEAPKDISQLSFDGGDVKKEKTKELQGLAERMESEEQ